MCKTEGLARALLMSLRAGCWFRTTYILSHYFWHKEILRAESRSRSMVRHCSLVGLVCVALRLPIRNHSLSLFLYDMFSLVEIFSKAEVCSPGHIQPA
jgi:hypothetical protein